MTQLFRSVGGVDLACRYTAGTGPTVVFVAGLGDAGSVWAPVVAHLPEGSSTFTYDRAGCGDSQPLPGPDAAAPRPASWAANQLRELLLAAQVAKPWVLVGHSISGLVIEAFAHQWPADFAGMVLVDASDPTLDDRLDTPKPLLADGDKSAGWLVSMPATRSELEPAPPSSVNTVVIGSAVWRWLRVDDAAPYQPLADAPISDPHRQQSIRNFGCGNTDPFVAAGVPCSQSSRSSRSRRAGPPAVAVVRPVYRGKPDESSAIDGTGVARDCQQPRVLA